MNGWNLVKLEDILTESKIESTNPDSNRRIRVRLNMDGIEKRPDTNDKEGATKYYVRSFNQFIYGRQNLHKGAFGIVPPELDGFESSSDIPAFDVAENCTPEWVFYYFKQGNFYLKLESLAKGIGSKRISTKQVYELKIPLPPLEEQYKIISIIKENEYKASQLRLELSQFEVLNTKLKDSIFSESIQGKLTKGWRIENNLKETGTLLLKQIRDEKAKLIREKKIKKEKLRQSITKDQIPFKIPRNWAWCRYSDLIEPGNTVSYGVLIPEDHVPNGIPLIRIGDLDGAEVGRMPTKYIKEDIANKYKRTQLKGGEILIVVVGASIGKAAIAHKNWRDANIARAVSRTFVNKNISTKYLYYVIHSSYIQNYFSEMTHSVGQPTLNINAIEKAIIPLPPLLEQQAIVEKIEILLDINVNLEKQLSIAKDKLSKYSSTMLTDFFGPVEFDLPIVDIKKRHIEQSEPALIFTDIFSNNINNNTDMELEELLRNENGKMSAVKLWKASKFEDNIDEFYENLKYKIEDEKLIKESSEKGFLELIA